MNTMLPLAEIDWVALCKTSAVVVVALAFVAITLRAVLARPGDMRRGAAMPLDDVPEINPQPKA